MAVEEGEQGEGGGEEQEVGQETEEEIKSGKWYSSSSLLIQSPCALYWQARKEN